MFSLMLMERLEEGALLSLLCRGSGGEEFSSEGLVGETAFLNVQKVVTIYCWRRWRKLLLLMVLLSSPQQKKNEPLLF